MCSLTKLFFCGLALSGMLYTAESQPMNNELIRQFESQRHMLKACDRSSLDADSLHSYNQTSLSLDYRIEDGSSPLIGTANLTIVARQALTQIPLNAVSMTIQSVQIQQIPVPYSLRNDTLYVSHHMNPGESVTLSIQISVPLSRTQLGYHFDNGHAYTMAEPDGARRWFPCFDQPFDKLSDVTIAVNMPETWSLASNGELIETTFPSAGRIRQVYHHGHPISTYLVMIAAGTYARHYETHNNIEFRYFTYPADSARALVDWQRTPDMLDFFSRSFAPYPFEQYGMVEAPFLGAMEHQTFTTWGEGMITGDRGNEDIVAHELAHQWFGDDISPVDFCNIWLNEGFATYCTDLYYEQIGGDSLLQLRMQHEALWYFAVDDGNQRHPIYDPPAEYMFSHVVYEKGAWVLHMLRKQILGDSLFFAAMRTYATLHHGGTVNTEDFIAAVDSVYGQDLHWFFDQWVYHARHPIIYLNIQRGVPTARDVTITVVQTQVDEQTRTPLFRFPLSFDIRTASGTTTRIIWFNQQTQVNVENFPEAISSAALSPVQPLLFQTTPSSAPPTESPVISTFTLGKISPNPFNSSTTISYILPKAEHVSLRVFDLLGREVAVLKDGFTEAGNHLVLFDGRGIASGIYFARLDAERYSQTKKIVLIK